MEFEGGSAGRSSANARQESLRKEHLSDVQRAAVVAKIGVLVWPLFIIYDALEAHQIGEGDLGTLVALRLVPMPIFAYGAYRLGKRPYLTERAFHLLVQAAMQIISLTLAAMCVATDGFLSLYVAGNMLCAAGVVFAPRPFWPAYGAILLAASMHPLVLGIATLHLPYLQEQLADPRVRTTIAQQAFVAIFLGMAIAGISHTYWSMRRELFESRSIGRYKLSRLLGKGGMSEVWAAYHRSLEREVALKILEARFESEEVAGFRFGREVRATARLTHPHTIRIFDFGATDDGLLYYAMELLDGENLTRFVKRRGPLPIGRAIHLARDAARALAEAHATGIVHRDIKPENLFVATLGREPDFVKVLDFGIATVVEEEGGVDLTKSGHITGTASSMSPEVVQGAKATPASDVYGMGVVLYFMLTARLPFEGEGTAVLFAHVYDTPPPMGAFRSDSLPPTLEALVARCLAKQGNQRFADGGALARALDGLAEDHPWIPQRDADLWDAEVGDVSTHPSVTLEDLKTHEHESPG